MTYYELLGIVIYVIYFLSGSEIVTQKHTQIYKIKIYHNISDIINATSKNMC